MLRLLNNRNLITKRVFTNNTLILKDLNSAYLIINYRKFSLDVEFSDDLLEIISSKIKSRYNVFNSRILFINLYLFNSEY